MNWIHPSLRATSQDVQAQIQIQDTDAQMPAVNFTNFSIIADHNYSISFSVQVLANTDGVTEVGIPCEFPNYLLQHNFPLTWAINATNYAAHCFMLNSSLLKNTCNFTISDEENFTYNTGNYTLWALPMLIPGQNWAGTDSFPSPSNRATWDVFMGRHLRRCFQYIRGIQFLPLWRIFLK